METRVQLTFRHVDASPAVEASVKKFAAKLSDRFGRITRCCVVVEGRSAHHHKVEPFNIRIELGVPGRDIIAQSGHDDVYVAVRQSFEHAERQLQQFVQTA